eukprot:330675-Pyramimonas_sp.AAC.1
MSTKAAESAVLVNFATDMLLKFEGVNAFGSDMLVAGAMLGHLEMFAKLGQSAGIKFAPKNHVLGHLAHRNRVI